MQVEHAISDASTPLEASAFLQTDSHRVVRIDAEVQQELVTLATCRVVLLSGVDAAGNADVKTMTRMLRMRVILTLMAGMRFDD